MPDKTVAQKLLIKPGQRFLLLNAPDGYLAYLGELPAGVAVDTTLSGQAEVIQCFLTSRQQLEEMLPGLKAALKPGAILWLTYPKLTSKLAADISRDTIWQLAATLGLGPVSMIAVDDDWSGFRLKVV
jgi:hypothetical protein